MYYLINAPNYALNVPMDEEEVREFVNRLGLKHGVDYELTEISFDQYATAIAKMQVEPSYEEVQPDDTHDAVSGDSNYYIDNYDLPF